MKKKNYCLLKLLDSKGFTQGELVRRADLASETRFSQVINGYKLPTDLEIEKICLILSCEEKDLGFTEGVIVE